MFFDHLVVTISIKLFHIASLQMLTHISSKTKKNSNFIKKRTYEFIGLILISMSIGLAIAFTTYSPEDPSFVYGDKDYEINNFFGI